MSESQTWFYSSQFTVRTNEVKDLQLLYKQPFFLVYINKMSVSLGVINWLVATEEKTLRRLSNSTDTTKITLRRTFTVDLVRYKLQTVAE